MSGHSNASAAVPLLLAVMVIVSIVLGAADGASKRDRGAGGGTRSRRNKRGHDECLDSVAEYKLTFHGAWSKEKFPRMYPRHRPPAQWSRLVGRSHNEKYRLFKEGSMADEALKRFAEEGDTTLYDAQPQGYHGIFDTFNCESLTGGEGRTSTFLLADGLHNRLSLVVKIVPSPDWFVGVDGLELCRQGRWRSRLTANLRPLDAGTDRGYTFTSPNWPSSPREAVYEIKSNYPDHPASAFLYPENPKLPRIAHMVLERVAQYTRNGAVSPVKAVADRHLVVYDSEKMTTNTNATTAPTTSNSTLLPSEASLDSSAKKNETRVNDNGSGSVKVGTGAPLNMSARSDRLDLPTFPRQELADPNELNGNASQFTLANKLELSSSKSQSTVDLQQESQDASRFNRSAHTEPTQVVTVHQPTSVSEYIKGFNNKDAESTDKINEEKTVDGSSSRNTNTSAFDASQIMPQSEESKTDSTVKQQLTPSLVAHVYPSTADIALLAADVVTVSRSSDPHGALDSPRPNSLGSEHFTEKPYSLTVEQTLDVLASTAGNKIITAGPKDKGQTSHTPSSVRSMSPTTSTSQSDTPLARSIFSTPERYSDYTRSPFQRPTSRMLNPRFRIHKVLSEEVPLPPDNGLINEVSSKHFQADNSNPYVDGKYGAAESLTSVDATKVKFTLLGKHSSRDSGERSGTRAIGIQDNSRPFPRPAPDRRLPEFSSSSEPTSVQSQQTFDDPQFAEVSLPLFDIDAQPEDCLVNEWSSWSACSKSCGFGVQIRTREVVSHSKNGGYACPVLLQETLCGSMRNCGWEHFTLLTTKPKQQRMRKRRHHHEESEARDKLRVMPHSRLSYRH